MVYGLQAAFIQQVVQRPLPRRFPQHLFGLPHHLPGCCLPLRGGRRYYAYGATGCGRWDRGRRFSQYCKCLTETQPPIALQPVEDVATDLALTEAAEPIRPHRQAVALALVMERTAPQQRLPAAHRSWAQVLLDDTSEIAVCF